MANLVDLDDHHGEASGPGEKEKERERGGVGRQRERTRESLTNLIDLVGLLNGARAHVHVSGGQGERMREGETSGRNKER